MNQSLLITGGQEQTRTDLALALAELKPKFIANNPDFLLLYSPESLGIEEIRNLQHWLSLKPFQEKKKIILIKEAQSLTPEAQNALLKTLEEPPPNSLIILTVPDRFLLLPTIISRCQISELPATTAISLDNPEKQRLAELLPQLCQASIGERFNLLEKEAVYKDRLVATLWLDKLTLVAREKLPLSLATLKNILATKALIAANVNLRLSLEVFLIALPA